MSAVEEILKSDRKPKEKALLLAEVIKKDKASIRGLIECFERGTAIEKGTCMEAITLATESEPELAASCLDFVIEHIDDDAPRVKWEAARAIGNIAGAFPNKVATAVPKLLLNTKDEGTVARWSAAYALAEVAKNNPGMRKELCTKFEAILKREKNNGVRNVYLKAMKKMAKM
jgi:hypothetical protein